MKKAELLIQGVCEKFAGARESCPGMSDEVYAICDYLAAVANDTLKPAGITMMLIGVMSDLDKKRCGFADKTKFPEYLATHSLQAKAQLPYVLQVVDAIAEEDFAEAVRADCKEVFHWNIPKRVKVSSPASEHANINAAVNWWTEAIQCPKMDNGTDELSMLMAMLGGGSNRQLTESELQIFREKLTEGITHRMEEMGCATLSVDYGPDWILGEAGSAIGLGQFSFPCKTTMWITENKVSVSAGYSAPEETIWSANV